MITILIKYHIGETLRFLITFPDGTIIEVPIFGLALQGINRHYDLRVIETCETYDIVMPVLKTKHSEKEES